MMNKKAFTLRGFIVGLIIFSMIAVAFTGLTNMAGNTYGTQLNITGKYDRLEDLTETSNTMLQQIRSNQSSTLEVLGFFTKGSFSLVQTMLGDSFQVLGKITDQVMAPESEGGLGIPAPFVAGFLSIVLIIIMLIIGSAIFRWGL